MSDQDGSDLDLTLQKSEKPMPTKQEPVYCPDTANGKSVP